MDTHIGMQGASPIKNLGSNNREIPDARQISTFIDKYYDSRQSSIDSSSAYLGLGQTY